ncbi:acylphosphatase [Synechocystis sp. PCC 7509]|uniref:acylphosphatase n=1 Tax=Synechocystis sp. PCC 7509 TaxID=927677 RepID=UPI000316D22B|nr:acylphosphatase [Synechocystis sp. PCC 7509]
MPIRSSFDGLVAKGAIALQNCNNLLKFMPNSPPQAQLIRYHVLGSGKVQGVGYQRSVMQAAKNFNLKGWVGNLLAAIEAVFTGNIRDTDQMLGGCRQENSRVQVKGITVKQEKPEGIQSLKIRC